MAVVDTDTHSKPAWRGGYEAYNVHCNALPAAEIFAHYERCGFLYPAKRAQLAPYLDRVVATWDASMQPPERDFVHHCLVSQDPRRNAWGTVSIWRSSLRRLQSQHLVSSGWSDATRHVMLAAQEWGQSSVCNFAENWFRSENRYPNRVFGSVVDRLGPSRSVLERRSLFAASKQCESGRIPCVEIHPVGDADGVFAAGVLSRLAGPVVAAAEELDTGDVSLRELNDVYARAGLSRSREVHLATLRGYPEPVGLSCAYRGPLGLNFSFLENRCDLWIDGRLDEMERRYVACSLIDHARPVYQDSLLPYILVACDEPTLDVLLNWTPGQHIRTYSRCIWTRDGFWEWYQHVDSFYNRVVELETRRRARAGESSPNGAAT